MLRKRLGAVRLVLARRARSATRPSPKSASARGRGLGRRRVVGGRVEDRERAALGVDRQRRAQRLAARLAVDLDGVVARLRAEGDAAAGPAAGCDSAPARARPVPFWRKALAPVIATSPRVERRRGATTAGVQLRARRSRGPAPCGTARRRRSRRGRPCRSLPSRAPELSHRAVRPDLDDAALRAGHGAADEQQVLVGDHVDDLEAALGHALVAHLARAANALEHARRAWREAPIEPGARTLCEPWLTGPRREVVALDRALEALALRGAGDLDASGPSRRRRRSRSSPISSSPASSRNSPGGEAAGRRPS